MIDFENTKSDRRERVFQMLFSVDFESTPEGKPDIKFFYDEDDNVPTEGYVFDTFYGAVNYIPNADTKIEADSKNWSIARMSGVTRAILRLAIYELLCTNLPPKVAINEAVELSKKYGDESEPSFINGILNRIAREENKI